MPSTDWQNNLWQVQYVHDFLARGSHSSGVFIIITTQFYLEHTSFLKSAEPDQVKPKKLIIVFFFPSC